MSKFTFERGVPHVVQGFIARRYVVNPIGAMPCIVRLAGPKMREGICHPLTNSEMLHMKNIQGHIWKRVPACIQGYIAMHCSL